MNTAPMQTPLILMRAAAQIGAGMAAYGTQAFAAAVSPDTGASWPAALARTLDFANQCSKTGTAAFNAVWQAQRDTLGLDAAARALRALNSVQTDTASTWNELSTRATADGATGLREWLLAASKARDADDLTLGTFLFLQQWQDMMKTAGTGVAGLASRAAGASLEALRGSLQDSAPDAPDAASAS
ncbi:hypothetical protein EFP18_10190 [Burkholderia glumae]|uniref:hypothetical protein n=2 Tax=Burkholderia glumae TaxID=337 RepID=UPI0003819367|nr:hypothetical protein [Burkholderia glumae]MCR1767375.1 hypothetical protein [Burkholderia glumae]NVE24561.1 hypothetical protein [Burkholderia glumae]PJO22687.1 hypothetical protein Y5A_012860 [Burkholderia glumae AU6208]QGA40661.1 hypothetical protein GAS19_24610 [Burkholderia glumae]QHE13155.1 hypothetical protein GQR88_23070 [Burkholderia glumae AU6208]